MKNKALIITLIIVLVAALATGTFFVVRQIKKNKAKQEPTTPEPSLKTTSTEIISTPTINKERLNIQVQELSTIKAATKASNLRALINQPQQS
jgi:flagellar basal body-associated protein FliL